MFPLASDPVIPTQRTHRSLNKRGYREPDLQGLIKELAGWARAACSFTPVWLQPRGLQRSLISARKGGTARLNVFLKVVHNLLEDAGKIRSIRYPSMPGWLSKLEPVGSPQLAVKASAALRSDEGWAQKSLGMFSWQLFSNMHFHRPQSLRNHFFFTFVLKHSLSPWSRANRGPWLYKIKANQAGK